MKRKSPVMAVALAGLFMYTSCSPTEQAETKDYTQYVNTFIGAADNGHTFPGACYPFGMIQTSPVTGAVGWRYCSEYTYQDSLIWGFTQTHLNGTGCMDLGGYSGDRQLPVPVPVHGMLTAAISRKTRKLLLRDIIQSNYPIRR